MSFEKLYNKTLFAKKTSAILKGGLNVMKQKEDIMKKIVKAMLIIGITILAFLLIRAILITVF